MRSPSRQRLVRYEHRTLYVGRWALYLSCGLLWLDRGPNPKCPDCFGDGGWFTASATDPAEPIELECTCAIGPVWQVRYRPRRAHERIPAPDPWLCDEPPF